MRGAVEEHPTGIATAIAAALVALANDNGWLVMSETTSVLVVGAVAAIVSLFTPRFRRS